MRERSSSHTAAPHIRTRDGGRDGDDNRERHEHRLRVAVVTGSRADFGLLAPVMAAIARQPCLQLQTVVTGTHLLPEVNSRTDVAARFAIDAEVRMQVPGAVGRAADIEALARGLAGLGDAFERLGCDVVLVLGDRIEAFAAAAAASVGGRLLAHVHGGDRAEGVADEAIRHAISKLAHLHFAATPTSARRLVAMGEDPAAVHVAGSPAVDEALDFQPLTAAERRDLGLYADRPYLLVLHHSCGLTDAEEEATMRAILDATDRFAATHDRLILAPNHDPGRVGVLRAIGDQPVVAHLPRAKFAALLSGASCVVGNSSAGLIEAAVLRVPCVNVGPRQAGRERAGNVIDVAPGGVARDGSAPDSVTAGSNAPGGIAPDHTMPDRSPDATTAARAIDEALRLTPTAAHPYGDGHAGERIAATLSQITRDPASRPSIRKRNSY